jgi:hypothetical protein
MSTHTLKPAAAYLPKMGKKALSLLAAEVTPEMAQPQALETIRTAWKASVVNVVRDTLAKDITAQLAEIVEEHAMLYGDRPNEGEIEYDGDLDDVIQASFDEKFWGGVGASGLVEHTTDTRADLLERRVELGQRLAGEIIANGEWLVLSDAEAQAILDANPPKADKANKPADTTSVVGTQEFPQTGISYESAWSTGVKLVREALDAGTHDVLTITDELDLCIDSDDVLGTAGAQRLAPQSTPEVVRACMQILAGKPGPDGAVWTEALVMAALSEDAPQPLEPRVAPIVAGSIHTADATGTIDPHAPKHQERKTPAEQTASTEHAHAVMMRMLELAGMPEQAMADILGCSRAMVNAAAKGRKQLDWTPERVAKLKQAAMEFATNVATFHEEAGEL